MIITANIPKRLPSIVLFFILCFPSKTPLIADIVSPISAEVIPIITEVIDKKKTIIREATQKYIYDANAVFSKLLAISSETLYRGKSMGTLILINSIRMKIINNIER
jgi:hypothetical protein